MAPKLGANFQKILKKIEFCNEPLIVRRGFFHDGMLDLERKRTAFLPKGRTFSEKP
jgi:hypothetical protein